ncbi:MAG: lytic transglycosylase domain-containing protein [bacterium]|nr:lytic transglycosylase domain-containing protein [bacterium]
MRQLHIGLFVTAILAIVACAPSGRTPTEQALRSAAERLDRFSRAVKVRFDSPLDAAEIFAEAGPGAELETARLELWLDCLERAAAPAQYWNIFLGENPSAKLERRARLGLSAALIADRRPSEAAAALQPLVDQDDREGLKLLMSCGQVERIVASRRLAVVDPAGLGDVGSDIETAVLRQLTASEWLERSTHWRRRGSAGRAARELGRMRWRGATEQQRRLERSRALIEAGQPRGALGELASVSGTSAEESVLRAQALRRRGWQQAPGSQAVRSFRDCQRAAGSVIDDPDAGVEQRRVASLLTLECGTESGDLTAAYRAWTVLMQNGWDGERLDWYARRLAVTAARAGNGRELADELRRSLPPHRRCLDFWTATRSAAPEHMLIRLAGADVADLYGLWAREELGEKGPSQWSFMPDIVPAAPPSSVQHLLDWGEKNEALREWRRVRRKRGVSPGEALAAAELARELGRNNEAIRWLLAGVQRLSGVGIGRAPGNVVRSYLPLRWSDRLIEAARAEGLDPWLLAGLARQESLFTAHAQSPAGAIGVVQLIPSTARMHTRALGIAQLDLRDPHQNLRIGARELARLIRRFGAVEPALAAYNAGETRARRWRQRWPDPREFTEEIPIPETYTYVRRVRFLAEAYRLAWLEVWTQEDA